MSYNYRDSYSYTMSLSRQFIHEFRPLFRMLDEPFGRPYPSSSSLSRNISPFGAFFNDPFFNRPDFDLNLPAVDLTEHANEFIVEAELPGVKKENLEIRIGDGGQSLTIEGKTFIKSLSNPQSNAPATTEGQVGTTAEGGAAAAENTNTHAQSSGADTSSNIVVGSTSELEADSDGQAITQTNANTSEVGTRLSSERVFTSSTSFSRTVWLPHRVDGTKVNAKLVDGVLTVRIPKAEDLESVRVAID